MITAYNSLGIGVSTYYIKNILLCVVALLSKFFGNNFYFLTQYFYKRSASKVNTECDTNKDTDLIFPTDIRGYGYGSP